LFSVEKLGQKKLIRLQEAWRKIIWRENCDIAAVGEQQQIGADVPGQQTSTPQRKLTVQQLYPHSLILHFLSRHQTEK
jgi:hypothetical protein